MNDFSHPEFNSSGSSLVDDYDLMNVYLYEQSLQDEPLIYPPPGRGTVFRYNYCPTSELEEAENEDYIIQNGYSPDDYPEEQGTHIFQSFSGFTLDSFEDWEREDEDSENVEDF